MKNKNKYTLLGGIIGDLAGSRFEHHPHKSKDFDLLVFGDFNLRRGSSFNENGRASYFTDDTVMTIAVAKSLLESNTNFSDLEELVISNIKDFGQRYPAAGYGGHFREWLQSPTILPYNSFGNGSAMRISPVAYFAKDLAEIRKLSKIISSVTHNHPEGIKGAEAVASTIWLALKGQSKDEIKKFVEDNYYSLDFDYNELLENYKFDVTCQNSVPQSIFAFLISENYEDAIRIAVSIGGDADTMACIAGSIAEAFYGVPEELQKECWEYLTPDIKYVINNFQKHFN
jgi:ADP-ribosylglycohydrolase